jgi:hypothetical protein
VCLLIVSLILPLLRGSVILSQFAAVIIIVVVVVVAVSSKEIPHFKSLPGSLVYCAVPKLRTQRWCVTGQV